MATTTSADLPVTIDLNESIDADKENANPSAKDNSKSIINTTRITATKRKADAITKSHDAPTSDIPEIDDDDPALRYVTDSCNVVRGKIRKFINAGGMKVGELQNELGVSSQAYSRFMGQNGPEKGRGCETYDAAFKFFKKRELQGLKMPTKKVKKEVQEKKLDVSGVLLVGEEAGEVPVYDTCDETRRKINAHLRDSSITKVAFIRCLCAHSPPKMGRVSSAQLTTFLSKKGPMDGNTSNVYYAAYVFFEKLRIKNKKPKSKHRLDMEDIWDGTEDIYAWPKPGMNLVTVQSNQGYLCRADARGPFEDKYGRISFA